MVRVAACQVRIDIDAPVDTQAAVVRAVERASAAGAELVVVPELALTGYVFADVAEARARAEQTDGAQIRLLRDLSGDCHVVLVAGWCEKSTGERPYNSAVVIDRGALAGCYRKTHLWGRETEAIWRATMRRQCSTPAWVGLRHWSVTTWSFPRSYEGRRSGARS